MNEGCRRLYAYLDNRFNFLYYGGMGDLELCQACIDIMGYKFIKGNSRSRNCSRGVNLKNYFSHQKTHPTETIAIKGNTLLKALRQGKVVAEDGNLWLSVFDLRMLLVSEDFILWFQEWVHPQQNFMSSNDDHRCYLYIYVLVCQTHCDSIY